MCKKRDQSFSIFAYFSLPCTFFVAFSLSFLCFLSKIHGEYYTEYWQSISKAVPTKGPVKFTLFSELRSRDQFDGLRFLQLSGQFSYAYNKYLTLEAHYTYIHSKPVVPNLIWRWQHRLELEANVSFPICNAMQIRTRNRFEIRKLKDLPQIRFRLRQRTMLAIPIKNMGKIKEFSIYNELFYDFYNKFFEQTRFYPWQVTLTLSEKTSLDVYVMCHIFFENQIWRKSYVLGTRLIF